MISSGCAAWPEDDTTYCAFSSPGDVSVDAGGNVDDRFLYVYGRVVAVGNDTKGETVSGTCWSRGCVPGSLLALSLQIGKIAYYCHAFWER